LNPNALAFRRRPTDDDDDTNDDNEILKVQTPDVIESAALPLPVAPHYQNQDIIDWAESIPPDPPEGHKSLIDIGPTDNIFNQQ